MSSKQRLTCSRADSAAGCSNRAPLRYCELSISLNRSCACLPAWDDMTSSTCNPLDSQSAASEQPTKTIRKNPGIFKVGIRQPYCPFRKPVQVNQQHKGPKKVLPQLLALHSYVYLTLNMRSRIEHNKNKTPVSGSSIPVLGVKLKRRWWVFGLFYKIDLCSATSMESSRRYL